MRERAGRSRRRLRHVCSADSRRGRIAQRRVGRESHVCALAEQLHINNAGQPFENARRPIPVCCDDFHDDAGKTCAETAGCVEREEAPFVQQRNARAAFCFVEIRRRHENRDALREKLGEQLPELAPRNGIDAGGRLVQQDDPRLVHERARERELLLHAPRQLLGKSRTKSGELCQLEQALPALANGRVAHAEAVNLGKKRDVFVDGEVAVQTEPLREISERLCDLEVILHRILAQHAHAPVVRLQ